MKYLTIQQVLRIHARSIAQSGGDPELINYRALHGVNFFRDKAGPAQAKTFDTTEDAGLLPAGLVARGWE
jgi:hypothetical protein